MTSSPKAPVRISRAGNFSAEIDSQDSTLALSGHVAGRRATGTLELVRFDDEGKECVSGPVQFVASSTATGCGNARVHYRERRTRQYVELSEIAAYRISCATARRVARAFGHRSRLSSRPTRFASGFRCHYNRVGNDVGISFCRRGRRWVRFAAYDSSPFH
jgi:hypothetical protein